MWIMDGSYNIGAYINAKKEECRKTAAQLQAESGIPETTYKRIVGGGSDPLFSNAIALVKAVGGSVDELVGIAPRVAGNDVMAAQNEGLLQQINLLKKENETLNKENGAKDNQIAAFDRLLTEKEAAKTWLKKVIKYLAVACVILTALIVGLYVYDITHVDRGFFQTAQEAGAVVPAAAKHITDAIKGLVL